MPPYRFPNPIHHPGRSPRPISYTQYDSTLARNRLEYALRDNIATTVRVAVGETFLTSSIMQFQPCQRCGIFDILEYLTPIFVAEIGDVGET